MGTYTVTIVTADKTYEKEEIFGKSEFVYRMNKERGIWLDHSTFLPVHNVLRLKFDYKD